MNIRDIHTHHHPETTGTSIIQLTPGNFKPQPGNYYSVGLHPWSIDNDWPTQMAKLGVMALHPQVVMIGEAGMDKKNSHAPLEQQIEVFRQHVRLSELVHKPLIIHCVKAVDELLALRKETRATLPWVLHGFRGGAEQAQQLYRAGISVSIGEHYNEQLVQTLPTDNLLLESDDLGDIDTTYRLVSNTLGIDEEHLQSIINRNILRVLNLEP